MAAPDGSAVVGGGGGGRDGDLPPDLVRGLVNTGNSCFLNAVLQALATLSPVHEWLRRLQAAAAQVSAAAGADGAPAIDDDDDGGGGGGPALAAPVAAKLLGLLRALSWPVYSSGGPETGVLAALASVGSTAPLHPRLALGGLSAHFEATGGQQQDAQELLTAVLEALDDRDAAGIAAAARPLGDTARAARRLATAPRPPGAGAGGGADGGSGAGPRRRAWAAAVVGAPRPPPASMPSCWLDNPFACVVGRRTECLACAEAPRPPPGSGPPPPPPEWALAREPIVTLAPPEPAGGFGAEPAGGITATSIETLLRVNFTGSPTTGYTCDNPRCGHVAHTVDALGRRVARPYNAVRWTALLSCPPVLALHVNRLQAGWKNAAHVRFDTSLDVKPFTLGGLAGMVGGGGRGGGGGGEGAGGAAGSRGHPPPAAPPCTQYDLMAVVVHLGGAFSGHYVTHRRVPAPAPAQPPTAAAAPAGSASGGGPAVWAECSDANVQPSGGEDAVRAANAYILFYVRRDVVRDRAGGVVAAARDVVAAQGAGGEWLRAAPDDAAAFAAAMGVTDTRVVWYGV
jgi:hypothetical protein